MASKSVTVRIRMTPTRNGQTVHVHAGGVSGALLLGKVAFTAAQQPKTTGATPELFISALLTQVQGLVLSN